MQIKPGEWDDFWDQDQVYLDEIRLDFGDLFPASLMHRVTHQVPAPDQCEVLEIGGGGGRFLAKFLAAGYKVTALDVSQSGLDKAAAMAQRMGTPLSCVLSDVFDLPGEVEGRFDLVYSMGLCEHFVGDQRQQIFDQHLKLLKAGGVALIMVPNVLAPFRIFWRLGRRILSMIPLVGRRYGVVWVDEVQFTPREFRRRCEDAGFDVLSAMGSSIIEDAYFWVWGGLKKLVLRPFGIDARLRRGKFLNLSTPLDALLGGHLFILARRPQDPLSL